MLQSAGELLRPLSDDTARKKRKGSILYRNTSALNALRLAFTEPTTLLDRLRTGSVLRRLGRAPRQTSRHDIDLSWEQSLHSFLGVSLPCSARKEFVALWTQMKSAMQKDDERIGETFDADEHLGLATWCAVRHLKPTVVIETGVARGITSWIILEALRRNDHGRLWSVDLPRVVWAFDVGHDVPKDLRQRWTLLRGSSERLLGGVIEQNPPVDLFIHDSLHTEENVRFELNTVWPALADGGLVIVDDIDDGQAYGSGVAFTDFVELHPDARSFVVPQNSKPGCFGVIKVERSMRAGTG